MEAGSRTEPLASTTEKDIIAYVELGSTSTGE